MIYVLKINKNIIKKLSKKPQGTVLEYDGLLIKYNGKAFDKKHYLEVSLKDYNTPFNALISEEDECITYNKEMEKILIVGEYVFEYLSDIVEYEYITIDDFQVVEGKDD